MLTHPLGTFLGAYQIGIYDQTEPSKEYAFIRMEDLWQEDVDSDGYSDDDESSDDESSDDKDGPTPHDGTTTATPISAIPRHLDRPQTNTTRPQRTRKKPQLLVGDAYDGTEEKKTKELR